MSGPDSVVAVRRYRLITPTTSFDAEAIALTKLLEFLHATLPSPVHNLPSPVHIYSDSLSILMALDNPFNQSSVIHKLKLDILSLTNTMPVHLCHVPGHSGVWGNELADIVATSAATRGEDVRGRLSKRMVRSALMRQGRMAWQRRWSTENTETELYRWIPNVLDIPSFFPPPKKLTHLITGHGRFPHYFHRLELTRNCRCFCGQTAPSISHYLQDCAKTASFIHRLHRLTGHSLEPPHLRNLLDDDTAVKILTELVEYISRTIPDI